ncbi:hypothetical protein DPMN_167525 [Dreissena polymorpha]|uniref:Uncharacterized protein n=1 Tax=Dreissena polymorpha TaxID=45954 RepID=A0A9D4IYF7_DREPO|nr:hypothetical protein DPMN_167525 [Dreissena polymorpha]
MPPKKKDKGNPQKDSISTVKNKKRKNAQVSPDNLNVHSLPEKRPDSRVSPSNTMSSQPQPQPGFSHAMNMSSMGNMNNYQTQPGAFYTPQQLNTPHNTQYVNASPQFQSGAPKSITLTMTLSKSLCLIS